MIFFLLTVTYHDARAMMFLAHLKQTPPKKGFPQDLNPDLLYPSHHHPYRVLTGHGKPGSHGISIFHFPGLESHGNGQITKMVLECHGISILDQSCGM